MKAPTAVNHLFLVATLLSISPLLRAPAQAQTNPQSRPEKPASLTDSSPAGYDLEIVDGALLRKDRRVEATLANVVDSLRERYPEANIVLAPGLARVKIADLKLRAGRLEEELEALQVASGGIFGFQGNGGNAPVDPTTGLPAREKNPNAGLFVLRGSPPGPETARVVEAFNLAPYFQWLASKDPSKDAAPKGLEELKLIVLDTIARLKEGDFSKVDEPTFQFHQGANLLIVVGTQQAISVARTVIHALPGQELAQNPGGGGYGAPSDQNARAAAEAAFRARYGLSTRPATPSPSPEKPSPGSGSPP